MNYTKKSIDVFLDELKSKNPVPGGGSVTALAGAMASGLLSMVCVYSHSIKNHKHINKRLEAIEKKSAFYLEKLKKLMQEDIDSYGNFAKAVKSKKNQRKEIKRALKKILKPPLDTLKLMPPLMEYAVELAELGKLNIVSDVSVAAALILACFEGAKASVEINLKALNEKELTASLKKEMKCFYKKLNSQKKNILKRVDRRLIKK